MSQTDKICLVIYRRKPGGRDKLGSLHTAPIVPRPNEYIVLNTDDASWLVQEVEYDYTTTPVTVNLYVR